MPTPQQYDQAVVAALGLHVQGSPVSTGDTPFWRRFGLPEYDWRTDVLAAVESLLRGIANVISSGWRGILGAIFGAGESEPATLTGGPLGTPQATVRWKATFENSKGEIVIRQGSLQTGWDTDLQDVYDQIDEWIQEVEAGELSPSSLTQDTGQLDDDSLIIF